MIVDLFAGPGGWDMGARAIGLDVLGIELDPVVCATRRAAGLRTLCADVATEQPESYPLRGLIASPPCPSFSRAGRRPADGPIVALALQRLEAGQPWRDAPVADPRSLLSVEPLRWALLTRPVWIALEQVPAALPLWRMTARALQTKGYHTWVGVVDAVRFGVPQTRRRALLLASRTHAAWLGPPTHRRYGTIRKEPRDPILQPWVSMGRAVGWTTGAVGFARRADAFSYRTDDIITIGGEDYRRRDLRTVDRPAFALTEKARSWSRYDGDEVHRVTVPEALLLQTFRSDFPVAGTRTAQFRQVANAVPPKLAAHALRMVAT